MGKYWHLRTLSAGAALLLLANLAQAQGTGTGGTAAGGAATGGAAIGGTTGGTTAGTGTGTSTGMAGSSGGSGTTGIATLGTTGGAAGGKGGAQGAGGLPAIPATSDPYSATYGNPRYMGLSNVATAFTVNTTNGAVIGAGTQGGFGQPTYTATTAVASPTPVGASNINNGGFSTLNAPPTPAYRTILSEDLPVAVPVPARIQGDIIRSIANSPFLRDPRGIFLAVDGSTVKLKGQVATEKERRVVEGVARLTPGVRNVVNDLVVLAPAPKQ